MFEDLFSDSANGFGALDPNQAEDLAKTFTVGHANGIAAPGTLTGGAALQMESVDGQMKSNTLSRKDLVMWPTVPQDRAYSLVEQYNRTNSYGDNGSPFVPESGSPAMGDSDFNRHQQPVVFFSTRRGVSIASQFVRNVGNLNAEAIQTQDGTMWLLEKLERSLYKGLADFSNAGVFDGALGAVPIKIQNLELRGIEYQLRSGDQDYSAQIKAYDGYGGNLSIIRSVGDAMDETNLEDHATAISENAGHPNMLDWAPKNMSDFVRTFFPKERVNTMGIQDGRAGYVVRVMSTTAGDIAFRPNLFLRPKLGPKVNPDRANVPGAPADLKNNAGNTIVNAANAMDQATATGANLKNGDKYYYTVASCNEQGEGNAVTSTGPTATTISADGSKTSFKIYDPSSGPVPTHFAVYRSDSKGVGSVAGNTAPAFIGYVARAAGGVTLFTDLGNRSEGAAQAYLLDIRPETTTWRQLAPMLRISQGTLGTAREFLLWLAGTLLIHTPRFSGIFENILRSSN